MKALKITGKILKYFFLVLVFGISGFLIFRVTTLGTPSDIQAMLWNNATIAAYEDADGKPEVITQTAQNFITPDGKFSFSDMIYIPEANQLQIILRYNNSTLDALARDMELGEVPDRSGDYFEVSLLDNHGGRYYPSAQSSSEKWMYNYRRYIFDGIRLEDFEVVYMNIYYNGAVDYEEPPYGVLLIFSAERITMDYDITKNDIKAMK